jgi:hypothetical protein
VRSCLLCRRRIARRIQQLQQLQHDLLLPGQVQHKLCVRQSWVVHDHR